MRDDIKMNPVKIQSVDDYSDLQDYFNVQDGVSVPKQEPKEEESFVSPYIVETKEDILRQIQELKDKLDSLDVEEDLEEKPIAPIVQKKKKVEPEIDPSTIVNVKCRAGNKACSGIKAVLLGSSSSEGINGAFRNARYKCLTCKRMFNIGY
jgi:hypothetical protein